MNESSSAEINQDVKPEIQNFINELNNFSANEEKIKFLLEEMKKTLAKEGKPDFKTFWEIKNICLGLFKEPLNASLRVEFWKEYIDLSNEVKNLKSILHEQTVFEVEQIDLAIVSIEEDLKKYDEVLSSIKEENFDERVKTLLPKKDFFLKTQKELTLLNAFAVRINSLRKEIIKMRMRIGSKNKLLKRLGLVGDVIFPKRKELIALMSEEFTNSIDSFAEKTFDLNQVPFFVLREEIKGLQNIAKKFTLNTHAFTNCRLKLSKCWDKVKVAEKNYKKERAQFKDIIDQVIEKIDVLKKKCEENPDEPIENEEKEIYNFMKTLTLRKEDVKFLRHKIKEAKSPIYKKQQREKEEKVKKENEEENKRKEKLENIKKTIISLLENPQLSVDELDQEKSQIEKELETINPVKFERLVLEKQFRALSNLIEDKKEKVHLTSSSELKDILEIFDQKKQRRQNIKMQLDNLNKELACSGFDFEKAMLYRDLIDSEKQRLEAIDASMEELEDKIADLESN